MSEQNRVELTKAEYDDLVDAVGYHCSHTGPVDMSLPSGCRDCDNEVRDSIAGAVARIIATRVSDERRDTLLEAADTVENAGDYGYGGWIQDDLRGAAYRLRELADETSETK